MQTLADFWPLAGFLVERPAGYDEKAWEKVMEDGAPERLRAVREALSRPRGSVRRGLRRESRCGRWWSASRSSRRTCSSRFAWRSPARRSRRASSSRSPRSGARRRWRASMPRLPRLVPRNERNSPAFSLNLSSTPADSQGERADVDGSSHEPARRPARGRAAPQRRPRPPSRPRRSRRSRLSRPLPSRATACCGWSARTAPRSARSCRPWSPTSRS